MKKYLFLLLASFLVLGVDAQDGKKSLKQASKSLGKYNSDPGSNQAKLQEAVDFIGVAMEDETVASGAKAWNTQGRIYNELANMQVKTKLLDPSYNYTHPNAAIVAFESFEKALELATKKGETKDALKGLTETEGHLNNMGIGMYQLADYKSAFSNFNSAIKAFKLLKANEKESRLDDPEIYKDQVFFTAVSGYYGEAHEEAAPLFEEMHKQGTDQALVYEALFNIHIDSDEAKAMDYLSQGREKFADDTGLLFAEINHYLKKGELDKLIDKLKLAIEKEPDNVSVYTTLGNVYDNLHSQARDADDMEKSQEYFDLAYDYYNQALQRKPDNFDATYSVGALYYNKAANMTGDLNAFANDFSKEGTKKYNDLKAKMDALFAKALPYFQKAESLKPNDLSTLTALKEIHARSNDFETSNAYKARIDELRAEEQ